MIDPKDITGLILAGGRGSRMGGVDKGLQDFMGLPLALHALTRLQAGGAVGTLLINANRNRSTYESFGVPVWPDTLADYAGPLAGFLTGLARCNTPYLVTVPCDTPLLPLDLVPRLAQALMAQEADIAMVGAPEINQQTGQIDVRSQPVFCLMRVGVQSSLQRFTQGGGRGIGAWAASQKTIVVPFDRPTDNPQAFANANTLADLRQLETLTV